MAKFIEVNDVAVGTTLVNIDTIEFVYVWQGATKIFFVTNTGSGSLTVAESYEHIKNLILQDT